MKLIFAIGLLLVSSVLCAAPGNDEAAIRKLIQEQVAAWNAGDATAFARHFATDGTFTNLLGMYFTGQEAFRDRHDQIFKGAYRGSTKIEDIVAIKFVRPDVAIVDSLQTVTGYQKLLPGTQADAKGRLRTRLLQVFVKDAEGWKIVTYHNVDVKAGVPAPEPQ